MTQKCKTKQMFQIAIYNVRRINFSAWNIYNSECCFPSIADEDISGITEGNKQRRLSDIVKYPTMELFPEHS